MGGRAAEEVVLDTMTNGAAQDIQDATNVARNMVAMYGMSGQFGMMALASKRNQYLDGGYGMDCAQNTAAAMDQAVKEILDQCYRQAVEVLQDRNAMYEMKVFGSQELIAEKWRRFSGSVEDETRKAGRRVLLLEGSSRFLNITYFVFVVITLAYLFLRGSVTIGQFAAVIGSDRKSVV